MQVIDDLIEEEIAYYKEIFKRDGIKGLLNEMYNWEASVCQRHAEASRGG